MKNNQSGRSMVEMLGVLAIIGVLSAGGLAGYSKAMFKHKLNSTMDQLTMLVTNVRTMYGTQENYEDLDVSNAYKLGIISKSSYDTENSKMINPFKGYVTLAPVEAKADVANSGFSVAYAGLPKEACIALATSDWGTGAGSGYIGVGIDPAAGEDDDAPAEEGAEITHAAQTVTQIGTKTETYSEGTPMKVSDAIDGCSGETNTVTLYFY